ncbi:hypothetical protein A2Z33_01645 [Candidatus Gottesmanbacteria bacterium RBG_16_52_11]|uniref:NADH:ubiquinone oxidoreductase-like 20kDa subunit domain-containing protein n=1 Tax=Candidatus Gottesmanbacteria bacterium RBG_16_52_11 TaxID=1798374 RepID=A0A1F5YPU9_9BACT|nr:MAG: hypothetical protein A2Z33_01645 [Candidatus Gottesmanbacteria bacterium RBG_16_52_11]
MESKKLRVGWFTFTCCEDSTIIFTELLNRHWQEWLPKIEFIHARVLQGRNRLEEMDVAFLEGAIASDTQAEKARLIRGLAKRVIAIGACACTGNPSAQRNSFAAPTKAEISALLARFGQADRVRTLRDVIAVDDMVQGCPMVEQQFITVLNKYFKEFGV